MNSLVLESGLTRFQSPNLLLHLKAFWTWAALIVAAIATFNSLIRRSTRILLRIRRGKSVITPIQPPSPAVFFADDDESCSSDDEQIDDDDDLVTSSDSDKDFDSFEEIQGQNGDGFSWPEIAREESVVKLWGKSDQIATVHVAAGRERVRVWDGRVGGVGPAVDVSTTWQVEEGVVRLWGEGDYRKVAVLGDEVAGIVRVVDLRKVRSASAEESWWYGDGGSEGLVSSWCRNAAKCFDFCDGVGWSQLQGTKWEY